MAKPEPIVAIDGPAGAGKSTVAHRLAERLGFVLVDTGALYRTVALAASRAGVSWADGESLAALTRGLVERRELRLEQPTARAETKGNPTTPTVRVMLKDEDVSLAIRAPDMSAGASQVSAHGPVRAALLELQREIGRQGGVVAEGRDIGTVVFPDAPVKFFLTAAAEARARRRHEELLDRGEPASFESTLEQVLARDRADMERAIAPLRPAEDAVIVDSTGKSVEQVIEEMLRVVRAIRLA